MNQPYISHYDHSSIWIIYITHTMTILHVVYYESSLYTTLWSLQYKNNLYISHYDHSSIESSLYVHYAHSSMIWIILFSRTITILVYESWIPIYHTMTIRVHESFLYLTLWPLYYKNHPYISHCDHFTIWTDEPSLYLAQCDYSCIWIIPISRTMSILVYESSTYLTMWPFYDMNHPFFSHCSYSSIWIIHMSYIFVPHTT